MITSSRRDKRESTIDAERCGDAITSARSTVRESPVIVTRDYEIASASRSGILACSAGDNDAQNPCGELSARFKRRNARGRGSVTTKRRGIGLRSRIKTKKITRVCSRSRDNHAEIGEENVEKSEIEMDTAYRETPRDHRQERSRNNIRESPKIVKNGEHRRAVTQRRETEGSSRDERNSNEIDKNDRSCISRDTTSKIPRPTNALLSAREKSRLYTNTKLPVRNRFKGTANGKLSSLRSDKKSEYTNKVKRDFGESRNVSSKKEIWISDHREKLKNREVLRTIHENLTNIWCIEKSSGADADEELEGDSNNESPVLTGTGDDRRSVALLRDLALRRECRSCNNRVDADRRTETDSWSSPAGAENARKIRHEGSRTHRDSIDANYGDLDFTSDYSAGDCNGVVKTNDGRNDERRRHVTRLPPTNNSAGTHERTTGSSSSSFLDIFFDIIFWPLVLLRAKR